MQYNSRIKSKGEITVMQVIIVLVLVAALILIITVVDLNAISKLPETPTRFIP